MYSIQNICSYLKEWLSIIIQFLSLKFVSSKAKDLEIIALRSQLALFVKDIDAGKRNKPRPTPVFRQLWVLLSKNFPEWKESLVVVVPETVIKWHRTAFKYYWAKKSKKKGRPQISKDVKDIILQLHNENIMASPEKIREMMLLKSIKDTPCANTIAKYLGSMTEPPDKRSSTRKQIQSWMTFLKNHSYMTWGTDFLTIPTIKFEILYVLIIIEHSNRKIVHFAVTKNPNMFWLRQQFRNATPFGNTPKYLVHDNDPVFKSKVFQDFLVKSNIKSKPTSYRSPWQNPYAERVIGTIRQELLNHVIPFNERHLEILLDEYINKYYNAHRPHQGLGGQTPIPTPKHIPISSKDIKLESTSVLNGLYHTYKRVA